MFEFDPDNIFESMNIEEINSNHNIIGLGQVKDSEDTLIPEVADIYSDLPDSFYQNSQNTSVDVMECSGGLPRATETLVKQEETSNNMNFDLISFIMGDVSSQDLFDEICSNFNAFPKQDIYQQLTPHEEKTEPVFSVKAEPGVVEVISIKPDPSPSTSKAASPIPESFSNQRTSARRKAPKRRYSSDSDFSICTSASSFNATSKRQKKRGRPAKELITNLPTIDDFENLPIDEASHLVLRIKNNEASRKSRMKSKSKQDAMEDECNRLMRRRRVLEVKRNKYDGQIETLRRWLLGQN